MRAHLALIRNVSHKDLTAWGMKLCEFLNTLQGPEMGIKAQGLGAHICLAALLGGQLVRHKRYSFHLEGAPLALFPHGQNAWASQNLVEHEVIMRLGHKDWLSQFKSLYQCPDLKGLHLSYASLEAPKRRAA